MKVSQIKFIPIKLGKSTKTALPRGVSNPINREALLMSAATASAITAATMVKVQNKKVPTLQELENKLLSSGYEKNIKRNCFVRSNPPQKDLKLYKELYNFGSDIYYSNVMELSQDNVKEFEKFLNIDPKIGAKMYHNYFDNLLTIFCNVKFNNQISLLNNKSFYKMITNIVMNMPDNETLMEFNKYKGKVYEDGVAKTAQNYLRGKSPESKNDKAVQNFISKISSYIDSQKIPTDTKIYRGERFYVLDNVKLNNGKDFNLTSLMKKAAESEDYNEIQKVEDFIKRNKPTATQPAFMSTSINNQGEFERKGWIFWELEPKQNTKGVYIDGINTSFYTFQEELLLQKGSKIDIEDASYDFNKDIWYLKGKVYN